MNDFLGFNEATNGYSYSQGKHTFTQGGEKQRQWA